MIFDQGQHLGNLAYQHLQNKRYQKAADLLEQALAGDDDVPLWVYHAAAQAWAGVGNRDKALGYLNFVVEKGWTDVEATKGCEEFDSLHGTPELETVLEQIQKNKQSAK